jgi:hypothetical protein
MKARERCLVAIAKWQGLLAEAEAEIQALRDGDTATVDVADDPDVRLATAVEDWKVLREQATAATVADPSLYTSEPSI